MKDPATARLFEQVEEDMYNVSVHIKDPHDH